MCFTTAGYITIQHHHLRYQWDPVAGSKAEMVFRCDGADIDGDGVTVNAMCQAFGTGG
jgi:hypothetical protein